MATTDALGIGARALFHLDAHAGRWITVVEMGVHLGVHPEVVRYFLEPMVANGLLRAHRQSDGLLEQMMINPAVLHLEPPAVRRFHAH